MALNQLIAGEGGGMNQMMRQENLAAREMIPMGLQRIPQWGLQNGHITPRNGDLLEKIYWRIVVGPAPQGYRWKRCWTNFFFNRLRLEIGGQVFWRTNSHVLQMEQLIYGSRGTAECTFDLDEAERTERSRESHEVFVEPLRLKDLLVDPKGIPLIRLGFHQVCLVVEFGSLADCLEPVADMPPPLPQGNEADEIIRQCEAVGSYFFLDTNERRTLAQAHETKSIMKHLDYADELFEKDATNRLRIQVTQDGICSAAYMWITDENNKELPRTIVDRIEVRLNGGHQRHDLTAMQSRHIMREQLPHPTVENNKSQNFYYISYWPGRTSAEGVEQGLNHSRIDNVIWNVFLKENAPARVKVHICHRNHNQMRIIGGMARLTWAHGVSTIRQAGQVIPRAPEAGPPLPRIHDVTTLVFPDPEKDILIPADEPTCMITYRDFEQGESVDQCGQCHKIFSTQGLMDWLKTRGHHQWKCVHCQGPYGVEAFVRGKARLAGGPVVAPVAQAGLLGRLQNAIFGGGYEAVHQD